MENNLTNSDLRSLVYYWQEKGDITRWVSWEEKKPLIKARFPEIVDALERFKSAEKTLDILIQNLDTENCDD